MAPLPKKKHTRRQRGHDNAHKSLRLRQVSECPSCHSPVRTHRACPMCGNYKGRTVPGTFPLENILARRQAASTATEDSN